MWEVMETAGGVKRWARLHVETTGYKPRPRTEPRPPAGKPVVMGSPMKPDEEHKLPGVLRLGELTKVCGSQDASSPKGPSFRTHPGEYVVYYTSHGQSRVRANLKVPPAGLEFRVEFIPVNGDIVVFNPKDARPPEALTASTRGRSAIEAVSQYMYLKGVKGCMLVKCEGASDILSYYCPERRARMCIVGYVKRGKTEEVYLFEFPSLL
jgi:hypothetical protein